MVNLKKVVTAIGFAASVVGFSTVASAKDFRLGLITPASHIWTQAATEFGENLAQASEGKHKVSIFPAAQLGNEAQMLQLLQTGALDMAFLTVAELSNRYSDMGALYAPYLVNSVDQVQTIFESAPAQTLLSNLVDEAGVVGVAYGTGGLRQIVSAKPVDTVNDLRGKKFRITPQEPLQDFYLALGAAPTALPLSVVYDALNNGQVDGTDMDLELIIGLKFYDKAQTVLLSDHMMFPVAGLVSARVWATLSEDDKKQIQELMTKSLHKTIPLYIEREKEWRQALLETDTQVKEVGPEFFGDALKEWEDKWGKKTKFLGELRDVSAAMQKN